MDDERCSFPAESRAWPGARAFVERRCRELAVPRQAARRLEIIAEELFINSAEHGGQGADGPIWLEVRDRGAEVELVIEDRARPFDPLAGVETPSASDDPEQRPVGRIGRVLVAGLCVRSQYRWLDPGNRVTVAVAKAARRQN